MSTDEQFAQALRAHAAAVTPEVPVRTDGVVPAARRRRAASVTGLALASVLVAGGAVWAGGVALAGVPEVVPGGPPPTVEPATAAPSATAPSATPTPAEVTEPAPSAGTGGDTVSHATVPADLVGVPWAEAARRLAEVGLAGNPRPVDGTGLPAGVVVDVALAGQVVPPGSLIFVQVSSGEPAAGTTTSP